MNHEQEALDRAKAGQFDAAQFHATMYAAQQQRLSNLIALADKDAQAADALFARTTDNFMSTAELRPHIAHLAGVNL